jgi:hypothetical protein
LHEQHVDAVVAHEVGHVKHHHLPWLLASLSAGLLAGSWLGFGLAALLMQIGAASDADWLVRFGATQDVVMGVACALLAGVWTFGFVARNFEWQADAFAVRHLSRQELASAGAAMAPNSIITHQSARTVSDMLQRVAEVNGMSTSVKDFRYGSIEMRQAKVLSLVGKASRRLPIDRKVLAIKVLAATMLLAAAVPIVLALRSEQHNHEEVSKSRIVGNRVFDPS